MNPLDFQLSISGTLDKKVRNYEWSHATELTKLVKITIRVKAIKGHVSGTGRSTVRHWVACDRSVTEIHVGTKETRRTVSRRMEE